MADPSSLRIGDRSACSRMNIRHAWLSDPNEGTPSGISRQEDSGGLSLQGGPDTPGKMFCESPNSVKYDWPVKPEPSGLGAPVFQKIKKQCVFQLAEWKISMVECCEK